MDILKLDFVKKFELKIKKTTTENLYMELNSKDWLQIVTL